MTVNRDDRIYVAGHRGMVGSAIVRRLRAGGYSKLLLATHAELDLIQQSAVDAWFARERPQVVFLCAAKVGGIAANDRYRADFIYQNLMIQANVVNAAFRNGTGKLLLLGSSCIYPKFAQQPLREEALLTGALETTNEPYAVAKIAGIKLASAFNAQYGTNFLSVMPTNLYGPGDSYDLENSHVLPALIRKCHEAKERGDDEFVVWGTGLPRREFLYSDDLADACVFLMERFNASEVGEFVNIGAGYDLTILELAERVAKIVGFNGKIVSDPSKPDGTPRKLLDVSRMTRLGWTPRVALDDGIRRAYEDFLQRQAG